VTDEHADRDGPEVLTSGSAVVLDIGGDIGAVIVYLGDQPVGPELDIRPTGDDLGRFHTGVHDRVIVGVTTRVAVFPEVRAATYELLDRDGEPFAVLEAVGGEVCTVDLRRIGDRAPAAVRS